jgi:SulP family sulfate permease
LYILSYLETPVFLPSPFFFLLGLQSKFHFVFVFMKDHPTRFSQLLQHLNASDLVAGLTVGILLIPQGLAYAMLAGAPLVSGLYCATLPLIIFSVITSSKLASFGPFALVSLVAATAVAPIEDPNLKIPALLLVAFFSGFFLLLAGVLRLGFLLQFLSEPVLDGFIFAGSLEILKAQLAHLGISFFPFTIHKASIGLSVVCFVFLAGVQVFNRQNLIPFRIPGAIVLVFAFVVSGNFAPPSHWGIATVGPIPSGIPVPSVDFFTTLLHMPWSSVQILLKGAAVVAFVAAMSSISVAIVMARKNKQPPINVNRELLALGCGNVANAFLGGVVGCGGLSRTLVQESAGGRSQLASLVASGVVMISLLFLTTEFSELPLPVLAAIIVMAIVRVFSIEKVRRHARRRNDLLSFICAFVLTLALGVTFGLVVAAFVHLLLVSLQQARPRIVRLGRLSGSEEFRSTERFPMVDLPKDSFIVRCDAGALVYYNARYITSEIAEQANGFTEIVWDWSSVNTVDGSFLSILKDSDLKRWIEEDKLVLVAVKEPVRDFLRLDEDLKRLANSSRMTWSVSEAFVG